MRWKILFPTILVMLSVSSIFVNAVNVKLNQQVVIGGKLNIETVGDERGSKVVSTVSGDVHHYDIGYMTIDGTQWEEGGAVTTAVIYDEYKDFDIYDYKDGDTLSLSAEWTIIKDKMGPWREPPYGQLPEWHPTCEEMWNFTIILYDEYMDIVKKAVVSIRDTLADESGKKGTVNLEYIFPREDFYGCNPKKLKIEIECDYYRWCWKPFDHWGDFSDLDNLDWSDLKIYFNGPNQSPKITFTSTPPKKYKFDEPISFTVTGDDGDGDPIRFYFDWDGDGYNEFEDTMTKWYYNLPATITIEHSWKKDDYPNEREHVAQPRVMVEDKLGSFSSWVTFGEIILSKNKQFSKSSLMLTEVLEQSLFLRYLFPLFK